MSRPIQKKPPIVLIHGLRGAPAGLESTANQLREAGYTVYTPAIPPFAGAGELSLYTPESYSDYLKAYLIKNKIKQPVLVGHSMGSIIVSAFAERYPELIDTRIILLSPIANQPAFFFRVISPLAAIVPRRIVDYLTTKFLFIPKDRAKFREAMQVTNLCSNDHPPKAPTIAKSTKFSVTYNISSFDLSKLQVALIAGEKDRLVGKKNIERLAKELPAKVWFIANSGHLHNYEEPVRTAELILSFLEPK